MFIVYSQKIATGFPRLKFLNSDVLEAQNVFEVICLPQNHFGFMIIGLQKFFKVLDILYFYKKKLYINI